VHPDTLAGGEVEEAAAAVGRRGLVEHDPLRGVVAAITKAALRSRIWRAPPPRAARRAEADVVSHVFC